MPPLLPSNLESGAMETVRPCCCRLTQNLGRPTGGWRRQAGQGGRRGHRRLGQGIPVKAPQPRRPKQQRQLRWPWQPGIPPNTWDIPLRSQDKSVAEHIHTPRCNYLHMPRIITVYTPERPAPQQPFLHRCPSIRNMRWALDARFPALRRR